MTQHGTRPDLLQRWIDYNMAKAFGASDDPKIRAYARKLSKQSGVPSDDELVYVYGLTHDKPVIHRILNVDKPHVRMIRFCNRHDIVNAPNVSFAFGASVMPLKHARRFAEYCQDCFA